MIPAQIIDMGPGPGYDARFVMASGSFDMHSLVSSGLGKL